MIKKILLFAIATIGLVACSKDDNKANNDNRGGNISKEKSVKDKLLGEWIGTYDIISEQADKRDIIIETLKKTDSAGQSVLNKKFDYTKARAVFDDTSISFYNQLTESPINTFDEYYIEGDKIIRSRDKTPIITYSFQGDKLVGEIMGYKHHSIIDEKGIAKDTEDALNKYIAGTISKTEYDAFVDKIGERNLLKFRLKFTLTKQQ